MLKYAFIRLMTPMFPFEVACTKDIHKDKRK